MQAFGWLQEACIPRFILTEESWDGDNDSLFHASTDRTTPYGLRQVTALLQDGAGLSAERKDWVETEALSRRPVWSWTGVVLGTCLSSSVDIYLDFDPCRFYVLLYWDWIGIFWKISRSFVLGVSLDSNLQNWFIVGYSTLISSTISYLVYLYFSTSVYSWIFYFHDYAEPR